MKTWLLWLTLVGLASTLSAQQPLKRQAAGRLSVGLSAGGFSGLGKPVAPSTLADAVRNHALREGYPDSWNVSVGYQMFNRTQIRLEGDLNHFSAPQHVILFDDPTQLTVQTAYRGYRLYKPYVAYKSYAQQALFVSINQKIIAFRRLSIVPYLGAGFFRFLPPSQSFDLHDTTSNYTKEVRFTGIPTNNNPLIRGGFRLHYKFPNRIGLEFTYNWIRYFPTVTYQFSEVDVLEQRWETRRSDQQTVSFRGVSIGATYAPF